MNNLLDCDGKPPKEGFYYNKYKIEGSKGPYPSWIYISSRMDLFFYKHSNTDQAETLHSSFSNHSYMNHGETLHSSFSSLFKRIDNPASFFKKYFQEEEEKIKNMKSKLDSEKKFIKEKLKKKK